MNRMLKFFPLAVLLSGCGLQKHLPVSFAANPVVAHRGAFKNKGLPENSVAALKEAIRLGCAGSEFDVRMTADDSLVVNHDPHYHHLDIEKTSYHELSKYRLPNGESLPLLRDYLVAGMQDNRQTRLVLEIKPSGQGPERAASLAAAVVAMVKAVGAGPYTTYISFDYHILLHILKIDPQAATQYLEGDRSPAQLKADGVSGADYHYSVFRRNPGWIREAKENGIVLNAWTVNDPADMDWLLEQGFDFITTNEPEVLLEKWKSRTGK